MHRLRALAATIALACTLTSCGSGDEPTVAPAPTSEATSEPTAEASSDSPTVAPADETAREFIYRWIELANEMQRTGDTAALLAVSGPDCLSCRKFAKQIEDLYANGGYIDGGNERIRSLKRVGVNEWVVETQAAPTEYRESTDSPVENFDGGTARTRFFLARVDGAWIVGESETVG